MECTRCDMGDTACDMHDTNKSGAVFNKFVYYMYEYQEFLGQSQIIDKGKSRDTKRNGKGMQDFIR